MGARRTPDELKSEIVRGTLRIIARGGMGNFSFPKLTAETGISAPTVYEYYKNKEDLLTTCFIAMDREISEGIEKTIAELPSGMRTGESMEVRCWLVWRSYWNFLISNADQTIFYWFFLNSNYYTHEMQALHREHFGMLRDLIAPLEENASARVRCDTNLLAAHMVNATAAYASKMLRGFYKREKATEETVYHMVFQPIYATLGIQTGNTEDPEEQEKQTKG